MERVRVEESEESLYKDCGWVNLIFLQGFSLKILFGSSLHFVGIRGIYTCVRMECEESVFQNRASLQLGLATWLSREFKLQANWMASLDFLSYSATAAWRFSFSTWFTRLHHLAACQSRATCEIQSRVPASMHSLEHFFTLSYTLPLHNSHLNTGFLSVELQAN